MEKVIYIHGKGGSYKESSMLNGIFDCEVIGLDYNEYIPWLVKEKFINEFNKIAKDDDIILVANSIGAYFSMLFLPTINIKKAYFISPVVNMKDLIEDMMKWANVSKEELKEKENIQTNFGETLSWEYLQYANNHPINWNVETYILRGEKDSLISIDSINEFLSKTNSKLSIMKNGEHWFHTDEQIKYLREWIKMKNTVIRLEQNKDYKVVENLVREAFWNVYRPGCVEHYVINQLRDNKDFVKELSFVMEKDEKIIGQIVFVKAKIKDDGNIIPILTMGPVSIAPEYKRKGYGKILLDYALDKAKNLGYGAVCIEGDYNFYSKCGFKYARDFGLKYHDLPDGVDDSFFLCNELIKGYLDNVKGEYETPSAYFVDEEKVEEFDKQFPHKEKLKLEGQIF